MEYKNVREVLPIVLPDILPRVLPGSGISASGIIEDINYRFVSDIEKNTWTGKQNNLGFVPVATNDPRLSDARLPLTHLHPENEPANVNIQAHVISVHAPANAQKNSDITKGEIEAKLTGEITSHSHAGGSGAIMPLYIPIAIPVLAALAWTNQPAALSFWLSTATVAKGVQRVDLTGYTQVRLLVNKQGTAGASAAKLILRYKATPFTQVVANYSDIGASEVSVAINVLNTYLDTGWINLAAGAKADVFLALLGSGGDGVLDPAFGNITAVFK